MRTILALLVLVCSCSCSSSPDLKVEPVEILGGLVTVDGDTATLDTTRGGDAGFRANGDSISIHAEIKLAGPDHPEFSVLIGEAGLVSLGSYALAVSGADSSPISCWTPGENAVSVALDGSFVAIVCNGHEARVPSSGLGIYVGLASIVTSRSVATVRVDQN